MNKIDFFKKVMNKSESDKVLILTNHYQIKGNVYECEECNKDDYINLVNVSICRFENSYEKSCEKFSETMYDWLHVNIDKIVAFSFLK